MKKREALNPDNIALDDFLLLGKNYFWFLNHIDAFSGTLFETMSSGGLVGGTNAAIIGDQFKRLKLGDRFFFSHETGSPVFKREIHQRTLSSVICDNAPIRQKNLGVIQLPVEAMKQGATASCPEIQGAGKPVDESATLDFGALAVEIVRSLEGRESNGVKPLISGEVHSDETNKPGLSECEWDDECESKQNQVDNKTLLLCMEKRCAYVRGRCVAEEDCGSEGSSCYQNYCRVEQSKIEKQRCSGGCNIGETCKMRGGKPVCV